MDLLNYLSKKREKTDNSESEDEIEETKPVKNKKRNKAYYI